MLFTGSRTVRRQSQPRFRQRPFLFFILFDTPVGCHGNFPGNSSRKESRGIFNPFQSEPLCGLHDSATERRSDGIRDGARLGTKEKRIRDRPEMQSRRYRKRMEASARAGSPASLRVARLRASLPPSDNEIPVDGLAIVIKWITLYA